MYRVAVPPAPGLPPSQAKSIFTVDLPLGIAMLEVAVVEVNSDIVIGIAGDPVFNEQTPAAESTTLRNNNPVEWLVSALDISNDLERGVLDVDKVIFEQVGHALVERQARATKHQVRPSCYLGVEQFLPPVIKR